MALTLQFSVDDFEPEPISDRFGRLVEVLALLNGNNVVAGAVRQIEMAAEALNMNYGARLGQNSFTSRMVKFGDELLKKTEGDGKVRLPWVSEVSDGAEGDSSLDCLFSILQA